MGLWYAFEFRRFKPIGLLNHVIITGLLISVFVSALVSNHPTVLGGITAYYLAHVLGLKLGAVGIYLLLIGCAALYVIATFKVSQLKFPSKAAAPNALQEDAEGSVMAEDEESVQTVSFNQEESTPEPVIKTELVEDEPEEELNIELANNPKLAKSLFQMILLKKQMSLMSKSRCIRKRKRPKKRSIRRSRILESMTYPRFKQI